MTRGWAGLTLVDMETDKFAALYRSGTEFAHKYHEATSSSEQVRLFRQAAAGSDAFVLGFIDGLGD